VTPEQEALRVKAVHALVESFTRHGITDPDQAAEDTIGWLIKAGWRPWPALADKPPAFVPRGTDTARKAAMERIRATFAERKASR
jgi:hypothetical protein